MQPQSKVYRCKPQSSISTHPFFLIFPHFQKYLNPQVRTKTLVNSVFYHTCPSRLASQGYIFLYFFKLLRALSIQNPCWIFSDLYIPTCVGSIFQFMVFTFVENHWIYAFLLMPQSPTQDFWYNFLKICFLQDGRGGGSYYLLCQNSIRKCKYNFQN